MIYLQVRAQVLWKNTMKGKDVPNRKFDFTLKGEGSKYKEIGFCSPGNFLENIIVLLKRVAKFSKN